MHAPAARIFLPGFGARACSYELGLPTGWTALQPPPVGTSQGSLVYLRDWLLDELETRSGAVVLAGHSMGAALAVLAAARAPERVSALVLIAPAGLPLSKPARRIASDFAQQLVERRHTLRDVRDSARDLGGSPRATIRLARALRRLDLRPEMEAVRRAEIPVSVIGCATDTLITPHHSRQIASLLAARYRELGFDGGHVWMFGRWPRLFQELARCEPMLDLGLRRGAFASSAERGLG